MVGYSYLQMGILEAFAGFFTYIIAMSEAGFWPFRLLDLRQEWDSIAINDVEDSYGQEWVRLLIMYFVLYNLLVGAHILVPMNELLYMAMNTRRMNYNSILFI